MRSSSPTADSRRAACGNSAPVIRQRLILPHHNETLVGAAPVIRQGVIVNHNETLVSAVPVIRHGLMMANHNETLVPAPSIDTQRGMRLGNHNETLEHVRATRRTAFDLAHPIYCEGYAALRGRRHA